MDKIEIGKKYRHFKGHIIEVTGIAKHSENLENNIPTEYETRFHALGFPIYRIEVRKEVEKK